MNAKKRFFRIVQAFNMHRIIPVIREGLHIIKKDPEYDKNGKAGNEFPRGERYKIKCIEEDGQVYLFDPEPDQHP